MLFAHGGLVPEKGALESAATHIPWWISNGAFPLYFIWETGIWTTLGNLLEAEIGRYKKFIPWFRESDSRGVTDWISDPAVELIARSIQGKRIWSDMKEAAEKTFSAGGDGLYFIEKLVAFLAAHSDKISLNLIGHSAGSIWHAYLLAALLKERPEAKIQTLSLLAPAMRSDLFKSHFMGASGSAIEELTIFTMDDTRERADHCEHVYQKSLLYLIHHSLENDQKASILGMDVCLRADRELAKHFGLQGSAATSEREVVFSSESNRNYNPRSSSSSLSHGGFDDDPDTLGSIARRILDRQDIVGFPASQKRSSSDPADALDEDQQEILTLLLGSQKQPGKISRPAATSKSASSHHGKKPGHYALCIGIDQYPDPRARLAGCVADARLWTKTFTERGFEVITCLDASATRDGIVQAITSLFRSAKSGDVIAIQFAGHGTEVEDLNGDEQDGDAIDEAFCCYDYASGNLLIDDDLGQLISDAPDGLSITFFMDCCHSGTNTRFGGPLTSSAKETGVTNRHLALRADEIANYKGKRGQSTTTRNSAAHSGNEYLDARETLFSACQPRQLAGEQNGHGLFTLAAVKALTESPLGTSNEKLHQRITALMAMHPNQNPGLHCDPSLHTRPFLT